MFLEEVALAETQDLEKKDASVVKLLILLVREFGDDIIFTGGTSLLKRDIIKRFSEDVDILTTISKRKIKKFINTLEDFSIYKTEDGSKVVQHYISNDMIEIKLDIVSIAEEQVPTLLGMPLHGISSIDNSVNDPDITIQVKEVEAILIDKVCAIIEEAEQIAIFNEQHEKKSKKKQRPKVEKIKLRRVRDFYDINSILNRITLSSDFLDKLYTEFIVRQHSDNRNIDDTTKKNLPDILLQLNILLSDNVEPLLEDIKEQTFEEIDKDFTENLSTFFNHYLGALYEYKQ